LPDLSRNRAAEATPEWRALVECARPYFAPARLIELFATPLHWASFLDLADDHGLLALLAERVRAAPAAVPAEIRRQLQERQRAQALFSLSLAAELFRVLDRFASCVLEVLLTKGPALAVRCYGGPASRQYTDLDFVIRGRDVERATEAMIALGYDSKVSVKSIQAQKFPGEYVFAKHDARVLVEFHTERTFRYHPRPLPVDKLFARCASVRLDGGDVPALSLEDELILISIHAAKHFWTRLMWVSDVAALITRKDLDWDRVLAAAGEVDAERMLRIGLLLSVDVLGARLPAHVGDFLRADAGGRRVAAQIIRRLPRGEAATPGLFGRAAFRATMRGGRLRGLGYLLRLSLSPTEEDWVTGAEEKRSWMVDAAGRPFRLARKYWRGQGLQ
jgi:Uncharacterised nucleotidyltransferase